MNFLRTHPWLKWTLEFVSFVSIVATTAVTLNESIRNNKDAMLLAAEKEIIRKELEMNNINNKNDLDAIKNELENLKENKRELEEKNPVTVFVNPPDPECTKEKPCADNLICFRKMCMEKEDTKEIKDPTFLIVSSILTTLAAIVFGMALIGHYRNKVGRNGYILLIVLASTLLVTAGSIVVFTSPDYQSLGIAYIVIGVLIGLFSGIPELMKKWSTAGETTAESLKTVGKDISEFSEATAMSYKKPAEDLEKIKTGVNKGWLWNSEVSMEEANNLKKEVAKYVDAEVALYKERYNTSGIKWSHEEVYDRIFSRLHTFNNWTADEIDHFRNEMKEVHGPKFTRS